MSITHVKGEVPSSQDNKKTSRQSYSKTYANKSKKTYSPSNNQTATPNNGQASRTNQGPGSSSDPDKKPSTSLRWANRLLVNAFGEFATDIHRNGAQVVYRWNTVFWEEVNDAEGKAMVARWLSMAAKPDARASTASDAWKYSVMRLHDQKRKPEATTDFVIPCQNAYLKIENDGAVNVIEPDQLLGLTHAVKVRVKTPVGQTHTPKGVPTDSLLFKFLSSSLPNEEIRAFVQEQCAMSFVPKCFGLVPTWFGPPAAGKSTMVNIVKNFHARPACISLHKLDESFGLEQILDATFIQVDEVESKKWCEATFKSLATGDPVTVNRKHKTPIASYSNRAMIFMTSNHSPFVTDNSGGVYRRLVHVHWSVSIPEEDRILGIAESIFHDEADIFLDWILEGIQRLMVRGRFLPEAQWPEAVRAVKESIRYSNDHVGAWMRDCSVSSVAPVPVPKESVYASYEEWSKEEGRPLLDPNVFWREVARRPGFEKTSTRTQARVNGKRCSVVSMSIGSHATDVFEERMKADELAMGIVTSPVEVSRD